MFANVCTSCGQRLLIFPSQITGLRNTAHGIELGYECWCGAAQTYLSGRDRRTPQPLAA